MLNPMYHESFEMPPRAIWPSDVPKPFEKLIWNVWPPTRFSIAKLAWFTPGS